MDKELIGIECYGQRLLNPYRGVVEVLRYQSAEAVTTDGIHWDIYVANDELLKGLPRHKKIQTSDIRYGSWSPARGLKRGPIFPSNDFRRMETQGALAYEALLKLHDRLPFVLRDYLELWLLDPVGLPLVLLDSVSSESEMDPHPLLQWGAGHIAGEQFASATVAYPKIAADTLTRYIEEQAGTPPVAQWFERQPDGSGIGLTGHHMPVALQGRDLSHEAFPQSLISPGLGNDDQRQLVDDYIAWQAPCLLLLPLQMETRRDFEIQARQQPFEVLKHCRLYPQLADEAQINAARVEAALRRQGAHARQDNNLSPYYIELNPGSGEYN
jgi:hypothetical protein